MNDASKLFKKSIDYALYTVAVVVLTSLLYVPIKYFSVYIYEIISVAIALFALSLILSMYYFAKDTPRRRWGKKKRDDSRICGLKRKTFFLLVEIVVSGLMFLIVLGFRNGSIGSSECPEKVYGDFDTEVVIKYFYSPFCPKCWWQERVIKDIVNTRGSKFRLEIFDVRYCTQEVSKYQVGAPGFVFNIGNETFIERRGLPLDTLESRVMQG